MSNHLISMAYKRDLRTPMRKALMVLLADKASDDGEGIWASKQTMADELNCSRQTIIDTIKGFIADEMLEEVGHRHATNGFTVEYKILVPALEAVPLVNCHATRRASGRVRDIDGSGTWTGQRAGRVKEVDATRQTAGHKPPLNPSPPVKAEALPTPAGDSAAGDDLGKREQFAESPRNPPAAAPRKGKRATGTRIPEDWQAPATAALAPNVQAIVAQWPSGAYELTALQFRNHWRAATSRATKSDWTGTWENWLIRESAAILRGAKAGQRFDVPTAPTQPSPAEDAAAHAVLALKAEESAGMKQFRIALRNAIGRAPYDGWVKVTAFSWREGVLVCTAPSKFKADWIHQHHGDAITAAAKAAGGKEVALRVEPIRLHICPPAGREAVPA